MQSQTRKNCLHWYKSIDHTVANELLLATRFDLAQGSHQAKKKTMKVSKKSGKHSNGKIFLQAHK